MDILTHVSQTTVVLMKKVIEVMFAGNAQNLYHVVVLNEPPGFLLLLLRSNSICLGNGTQEVVMMLLMDMAKKMNIPLADATFH